MHERGNSPLTVPSMSCFLKFPALHTAILEEWIDRIDGTLPPIVNFVIPVSLYVL